MYRPRKPPTLSLALLLCLALLANSAAAAAYLTKDASPLRHPQPPLHNADTRGNGNESAGSDIYGIGVRVSFYLQGIAFTMNAFTSETRKGMLLAAASVQAAVLASLSVLLARNSLSPAEVLIILDMIAFSTVPAIMALLTVDSGGQGLAVVLFVVDSLWTSGLNTWFWARGYASLPLLGTSNAGFFYTRVQIDGWFRIFSLVFACLAWFLEIALVVLAGHLLRRSFGYFEDENDKFEESSVIEFILPIIPGTAIGLLVLTIPLLVVATERMIQWNDLSPNTDLSAPGQVIPFAVGVVGICDATLGILRHLFRKGDRVRGGMYRTSARNSQAYE